MSSAEGPVYPTTVAAEPRDPRWERVEADEWARRPRTWPVRAVLWYWSQMLRYMGAP